MIPHPLAYIEWYTPFTRVDAATNMYVVSRSTRHRRPNAAIISVDRLLGPCHLIGKCGQAISREWTSETVLDLADDFFVNPYFTVDTFALGNLYPSAVLAG